jgi:hypothetical protein
MERQLVLAGVALVLVLERESESEWVEEEMVEVLVVVKEQVLEQAVFCFV